MSLQSREDLTANLHDKEYRDALVSSRVSNTVALQIRAMREARGWTQKQLAEALGTSQNAVYRLESPRYGKATVTTLKRLASIFDIGLAVWFIPFSKLVDRVTNLSTEDILVPSFENDPGFHEQVTVPANIRTPVEIAHNPLLRKISQSYKVRSVAGVNPDTTVRVTNSATVSPHQSYLKTLPKEDEFRRGVLIHSQLDGNLSLRAME